MCVKSYMYMCIYVYIYIHMKSSFPKHDKRHSKEMGLQCLCLLHRLCFGNDLFTPIYTCMCICTYL